LRQGEIVFENLKLQVDASYGQVSVEEFDAARANLAAEQIKLEGDNTFRTFREDYRIEGAEEGVVHVHYRGNCTVCKLKLEFDDQHTIIGR